MSNITRIRLRRDIAANWAGANPVLANGEVGLETDTRNVKVGDGSTAYVALPYWLNGQNAIHQDVRGQASYLGPTALITFTEVDAYVSTGLTATFDAATAFGMTLGTVDAFGLKNTSGSTKLLRFFANVDISGANFKQFSIRLALNGVSIAETECRGFSTGNEFLNLATSWMIELNDGDEVSLLIANNSSTDLIDLQRGRIVASEVR
jgi:hypothetical protein